VQGSGFRVPGLDRSPYYRVDVFPPLREKGGIDRSLLHEVRHAIGQGHGGERTRGREGGVEAARL
jgi:hypothetical protein